MKKMLLMVVGLLAGVASAAPFPSVVTVKAGETRAGGQNVRNFILTGEANLGAGAAARLRFHTDASGKGYEVLFHNGPIDGTRKTGSLSHIRNRYWSSAKDGEWFGFSLAVREKNIEITVKGQPVVRYTEGENPCRRTPFAGMTLSCGDFAFVGEIGEAQFRDLVLVPLKDGVTNPKDIYPTPDELSDPVLRLQQADFPVINWHVHAKGGWTPQMALEKSLADGIEYGLAVNIYGKIKKAGDGGIGLMIESDDEALTYLDSVEELPFARGFQGEGRKWSGAFTAKSLGKADYLFTDSMTIVDQNRQIRLYRPDEMTLNGRTPEAWMEFYVSQIEKILTNEPADIYVNPFYLPDDFAKDFDALWTDARIDRVLAVLVQHRIALEINSRYCLPGFRILKKAKARGIKFAFGTNNMDANIGRLEWALEAVKECGIEAKDMWFPTDSIRLTRPTVIYNTIKE